MTSRRVLLVDEPKIGLDPTVCLEVTDVPCRLPAEFGGTAVITEQNANFALSPAEQLYVLDRGHVTASRTIDTLRDYMRLAEAYFEH